MNDLGENRERCAEPCRCCGRRHYHDTGESPAGDCHYPHGIWAGAAKPNRLEARGSCPSEDQA